MQYTGSVPSSGSVVAVIGDDCSADEVVDVIMGSSHAEGWLDEWTLRKWLRVPRTRRGSGLLMWTLSQGGANLSVIRMPSVHVGRGLRAFTWADALIVCMRSTNVMKHMRMRQLRQSLMPAVVAGLHTHVLVAILVDEDVSHSTLCRAATKFIRGSGLGKWTPRICLLHKRSEAEVHRYWGWTQRPNACLLMSSSGDHPPRAESAPPTGFVVHKEEWTTHVLEWLGDLPRGPAPGPGSPLLSVISVEGRRRDVAMRRTRQECLKRYAEAYRTKTVSRRLRNKSVRTERWAQHVGTEAALVAAVAASEAADAAEAEAKRVADDLASLPLDKRFFWGTSGPEQPLLVTARVLRGSVHTGMLLQVPGRREPAVHDQDRVALANRLSWKSAHRHGWTADAVRTHEVPRPFGSSSMSRVREGCGGAAAHVRQIIPHLKPIQPQQRDAHCVDASGDATVVQLWVTGSHSDLLRRGDLLGSGPQVLVQSVQLQAVGVLRYYPVPTCVLRCGSQSVTCSIVPSDVEIVGRSDRKKLQPGHALPNHAVEITTKLIPNGPLVAERYVTGLNRALQPLACVCMEMGSYVLCAKVLDVEYKVPSIWSPRVHRHFDRATRKRVFTVLLVLHRLGLWMPIDVLGLLVNRFLH